MSNTSMRRRCRPATSSSRRSSSRPTGASAAGTSSRACSRTASSSSARPSTIRSPTSSSPSSCSSRARTRTRTSCSTSTRRAAWSRRAWRSTTPCSTCGRDVATFCMGQAASMGAFLLAAGAKGKRYSLPHARILIHQPLGGFSGQATDIDIHAKEILRTRDKLNELLVKHTGQPMDRIKSDTRCRTGSRRCLVLATSVVAAGGRRSTRSRARRGRPRNRPEQVTCRRCGNSRKARPSGADRPRCPERLQ